MTLQQVFDKVAAHLIRQGEPAIDPVRGDCRYRLQRGRRCLKCAAGCLIPRRYYDPRMENKTIEAVVNKFEVPDYLRDSDMLELVGRLQSVHDDLSDDWNVARLKIKLNEVAERHGLRHVS